MTFVFWKKTTCREAGPACRRCARALASGFHAVEDQVGFVWARKVSPTLGEIEPIGVADAYQGQGLGKALLAEGLHYLAGRGLKKARLGVWADNKKAIHLYQKFGFQQVDDRFFLAKKIGPVFKTGPI